MYKTTWKGKSRLDNLIKNLKEADGSWVEVGYFSDQLKHPTERTDLTFPELIAIHELRQDGKARPVLTIGYREESDKFEANIRDNLESFLEESAKGKRTNVSKYLSNIGVFQIKRLRSYFGNTSHLISNQPSVVLAKGADSPLVETGLLRDYLSYKTSKNKRTTTPT